MSEERPIELETDLWKESLLHNFAGDLELKTTVDIALPRLFMRTAAYFASKTALMEKRDGHYENVSYREVAEKATTFAAAMVQAGIKKGDRIALLLKNSPDWVISDMGTMMAAGATVPIYENLIPSAIQHILEDSETKAIIVENKMQFEKILEIWPQLKKLQFVVIRDSSGVGRRENVFTIKSLLERGDKYLKEKSNCVAVRVRTLQRDDPASIVYTSGTTGNPKGVILTHGNFIANVLGVASVTDINSLDTSLSFLPLSHAFERTVGYYLPLLMGCTIAYAESFEKINQNLLEVRPTFCCAVPRIFEKIHARMLRNIQASSPVNRAIFHLALMTGSQDWNVHDRWTHKHRKNGAKKHDPDERLHPDGPPKPGILRKSIHNLSEKLVFSKIKQKMGGRLRYFVSGGAPLSPELIQFFRNLGINIYEGYGMTETSPVISFNFRDAFEPGTVGKALPNVQVRISDQGEILAKGPSIMKGYFHNPKATDEIIDKSGWLHTGDIGTFEDNQYLKITDRIKELIVMSSGKNVAPLPIENKLSECPYIANAMVIGNGQKFISALIFPNEEELKSFAESKGIKAPSLKALCQNEKVREIFSTAVRSANGELSRYEQIKKFDIVPAVLSVESGELTPTLKIKRRIVSDNYKEFIERQYRSAAA